MRDFFFKEVWLRSWWVMAFGLFCAICYEQGIKERDYHYQLLSEQLISLKKEKQLLLEHQANLQRQINSQSDLAWIELTLMKGLGLVPEDQQKVYFVQDDTSKP